MKALRFDRHGKPDVLFVANQPALGATPGIAIVEMRAASINPSDVKNVAGRMSQTTLPRTPGRDYSGVVIDGPEQWIGREVWGSGGDTGSFSLAEAVAAYRAVEAGTPGRVVLTP